MPFFFFMFVVHRKVIGTFEVRENTTSLGKKKYFGSHWKNNKFDFHLNCCYWFDFKFQNVFEFVTEIIINDNLSTTDYDGFQFYASKDAYSSL